MFRHMREALGIEEMTDILGHIESLPTIEERHVAYAKIEEVEEDSMNKMVWRRMFTRFTQDRPRRTVEFNEGGY